MTATKPTSVPATLTAGDTAIWQRSFDDYPASDGWVLSYTFIGNPDLYSFAGAIADGDAFDVTIPAATTAAWVAGVYTVQESVTKAGERHTPGTTRLRITADLASLSAGLDTRSHAQKMLDAINAWLESEAPWAASLEFNGRKLANHSVPDILTLRDRYRMEVANEASAANGGTRGTRILTRF